MKKIPAIIGCVVIALSLIACASIIIVRNVTRDIIIAENEKNAVISGDGRASAFRYAIDGWITDMTYNSDGVKLPKEADIRINGTNGAWKMTGTDEFWVRFGHSADDRLKQILDDGFTSEDEITVVVYVRDKKAVACAYTEVANADLSEFTAEVLLSGKYGWNGKKDGITKSGLIVGTYPKCTME